MNAPLIAVVSFFAASGVAWGLLQYVSSRRNLVERRLARHQERGAAREHAAAGEQVVAGIRRVPTLAHATDQGPKGPLAFLFKRAYLKKRRKALEGQLVDALNLVSSSLKAGYSFVQAMEMAGRELPPPLGEEFRRSVYEMSLGGNLETALQEMAERSGVEDLDLVVTAVIIQRQVGGNLAEVLDNISHTIHERIRIRGEIKTLTAQGRISGWILSALPLGMLGIMSVLNPGYIYPLFHHPLGLLLIFAGVTGQLIGAMLVNKIVNIEV